MTSAMPQGPAGRVFGRDESRGVLAAIVLAAELPVPETVGFHTDITDIYPDMRLVNLGFNRLADALAWSALLGGRPDTYVDSNGRRRLDPTSGGDWHGWRVQVHASEAVDGHPAYGPVGAGLAPPRVVLAAVALATDLPVPARIRFYTGLGVVYLDLGGLADALAWSVFLGGQPDTYVSASDGRRNLHAGVGDWHGWRVKVYASEPPHQRDEVLDADTVARLTAVCSEPGQLLLSWPDGRTHDDEDQADADEEDLREQYAQDEADHDRNPSTAGYRAWLAARGGAR